MHRSCRSPSNKAIKVYLIALLTLTISSHFISCSFDQNNITQSNKSAAIPTTKQIDKSSPIADRLLPEYLIEIKKIIIDKCTRDSSVSGWIDSLQCRLHEQLNWDSKLLYEDLSESDDQFDSSCKAKRKKYTDKYLKGFEKGSAEAYLVNECDHQIEQAILNLGWSKEKPDFTISDQDLISEFSLMQSIAKQSKEALSSLNKSCNDYLLDLNFDDKKINTKILPSIDQDHNEYFKVRYLYPVKFLKQSSSVKNHLKLKDIVKKNWALIYYIGNLSDFDKRNANDIIPEEKRYFNNKYKKPNSQYYGNLSLATLASHLDYAHFLDFTEKTKPFAQRQLIRSCFRKSDADDAKYYLDPYIYYENASENDNETEKYVFGKTTSGVAIGRDLSSLLGLTDANSTCDSSSNNAMQSISFNAHPVFEKKEDNPVIQALFTYGFDTGASTCEDTEIQRCRINDELAIYTKPLIDSSSGQNNTACRYRIDGDDYYGRLISGFNQKKFSDRGGGLQVCMYKIKINQDYSLSSLGNNDPDPKLILKKFINPTIETGKKDMRRCAMGIDYIDLCGANIAEFLKEYPNLSKTDELKVKYKKYCKSK